MPDPPEPVVIDASTLINLLDARKLSLLGRLKQYVFYIPLPVFAEITRPEQRDEVIAAIDKGWAQTVEMSPDEAARCESFQRFPSTPLLDAGEASVVAVAVSRRWKAAVDDGAAIKVLKARLDANFILTTEKILKEDR